MEQKVTYLHYLIIGISIFFLSSCVLNECLVISNFILKNSTAHTIQTSVGVIVPNSDLSIYDESIGPCDVSVENYVPPFVGDTEIIFDDIKCLVFRSQSIGKGEGPTGTDNYSFTKISDNNFEFVYEFTELEYLQAMDCN